MSDDMNIIDLPKPSIPDMQAVEHDIETSIEKLEYLIDRLKLVHHVDKPFLTSAENNLMALKMTLRIAVRIRE